MLVSRGRAVDLDEHGEVASVFKGVRDRLSVRRKPIGCNLKLAAHGLTQPFDEDVCRGPVSLAHGDIEHQLAMPLDCHERVAIAKVRVVVGTHALLFFLNKAPRFVTFHIPHFNIANLASHQAFGSFTCQYQEFEERCVVDASKPLNARNRATLQKHFESFGRGVHASVHPIQGIVAGVCEDLAALLALVPLAILARAEFSAFGSAIVAGHVDLDLSSGRVQNGSGPRMPSSGFGLRLNPAGSFSYQRGLLSVGGPGRIWTDIPPFGKQALCPVELRGHIKSLRLYRRYHQRSQHVFQRAIKSGRLTEPPNRPRHRAVGRVKRSPVVTVAFGLGFSCFRQAGQCGVNSGKGIRVLAPIPADLCEPIAHLRRSEVFLDRGIQNVTNRDGDPTGLHPLRVENRQKDVRICRQQLLSHQRGHRVVYHGCCHTLASGFGKLFVQIRYGNVEGFQSLFCSGEHAFKISIFHDVYTRIPHEYTKCQDRHSQKYTLRPNWEMCVATCFVCYRIRDCEGRATSSRLTNLSENRERKDIERGVVPGIIFRNRQPRISALPPAAGCCERSALIKSHRSSSSSAACYDQLPVIVLVFFHRNAYRRAHVVDGEPHPETPGIEVLPAFQFDPRRELLADDLLDPRHSGVLIDAISGSCNPGQMEPLRRRTQDPPRACSRIIIVLQ